MEASQALRFIAAFIFVISLMWILSFIMKKVGYGKLMPMNKADRRLSVVEYLPLDTKNRMVLVRRDNTEHLLLVSADHSEIIESGIKAKPKPKTPKTSKKATM